MNLEGKIVFISGAITGIDGYRKIFSAADVYLFHYLILFVGAVLIGGIGIFIIPYVASWMQSLPH